MEIYIFYSAFPYTEFFTIRTSTRMFTLSVIFPNWKINIDTKWVNNLHSIHSIEPYIAVRISYNSYNCTQYLDKSHKKY